MSRKILGLAVGLAAGLAGAGGLAAQEIPLQPYPAPVPGPVAAADCCAPGADPWCQPCHAPACCPTGGIIASGEMTFFRYHRADGMRVGSGADEGVETDFNIAPRVTLGWVGADGFGIRTRWWEYHHTEAAFEGGGSGLQVDTYTIDVELFDTVWFNDCWSAEISTGFRVNEFEEIMHDRDTFQVVRTDVRENDFDGFGGLLGMELRRQVTPAGRLYARLRGAVVMDNKFVSNDDVLASRSDNLRDTVQGMMELAFGYETCWDLGCGALLVARSGAEWQNWFNYSSSFGGDDAPESRFAGPSDVGFGGLTFGLGIMR